MSNATLYFELARSEEKAGNECAALLFYLSSFCDSFNSGTQDYPYGTVQKSGCCRTGSHCRISFYSA